LERRGDYVLGGEEMETRNYLLKIRRDASHLKIRQEFSTIYIAKEDLRKPERNNPSITENAFVDGRVKRSIVR